MRKKTKSKKPSPLRRSGASVSGHPLSPPPSIVSAGAVCSEAPASPVSSAPTQSIAQLTVSVTDLANQIPDLKTSSGTSDLTANGASDTANGLAPSGPSTLSEEPAVAEVTTPLPPIVKDSAKPEASKHIPDAPNPVKQDLWVSLVKGTAKQLKKQSSGFTLPSGESCVKIPNSVIEKNRKSWECFVLGQFYSDPPAQGTIHNIVNGIWSKSYRDISVSKMEGNAFIFRIPNAATRARVINQMLWQIEGQTMFVANWEPGVVPMKPQLTSAPIWLELRHVPLQFFNDEGLESIASLVGDPKCLHPATANKTNLEVAKVFTIIDPRKPLPEVVNVQFASGEIRRILVSSPWMPPVCEHCKEVGHSRKRCKLAPVTCKPCNSSAHLESCCPRKGNAPPRKRYQAKPIFKDQAVVKRPGKEVQQQMVYVPKSVQPASRLQVIAKEGDQAVLEIGSGSGKALHTHGSDQSPSEGKSSVAEEDSSDILSTESEETDSLEETASLEDDYSGFEEVLSKRQRKLNRGKGLKNT
ncbi:uncharacterized protein LOC110229097 [Arabidopsis lyrata subsp. lyrata]|uniref:uncharacterized protein LOC110229097 n=1 Tax=Arabidopsis lyrata subsp. lyrata TaxID=81972 RepID=UPI000A29B3FB|nr:uncharacterized protein LOC110229097 [Arabidopsis lyrata subsp. lyrata]|eukprot:XP_020883678.1 uncharacterized protein LOC110229097 [Arabidopsis lyrata subsp. lyrata]